MSSRKKAYVETYGCQMNISDGELMSGVLASSGYEIVESPHEADVVLVNTCAIREHAEQRVRGRVAQLSGLRETNPDLVIGVTGCMAQRLGEDLLETSGQVDLVMGPDGYRSLPGALANLLTGGDGVPAETAVPNLVPLRVGSPDGGGKLAVLDLDPSENYEGLELRRTSTVAAWIPIQRGCDHRCTFCIVPYVRGPEKNRDPEAVLAEVADVAGTGVTEVTLLGQTVNSYRAGDWAFPRLLQAVARTPGIRRVRFTSPHPNDVTPELVEVMAREEAVCEQLHLPLQAGNDRTLKRMLRRHTVSEFLEKVDMVRAAVPDIALSTDLIVGFPGETEREFRDTLALVGQIRFDDAFTYRFSPRDGTPATRFPAEDRIPDDEAKARLSLLIEVTRGVQAEINRAEVGRVEEVLLEKPGREEGFMMGRTRRNKVVVVPAESSLAGTYVEVKLMETTGATFVGALAGHLSPSEPR